MPTTWTHARALATLEKAGWAETQRQGTEPAAFDRHDEAVRRVHGVLAEAGDAWATARAAAEGTLGIVVPRCLVAWQVHWVLAHLPVDLLTADALRQKGWWVEAEDDDDDEMSEAEVLMGAASPSPWRGRESPSPRLPTPDGSGGRAPAAGDGGGRHFRRDVRDPGSWSGFAVGELEAEWKRTLREAGVGGGAQVRESAFLSMLADRMARALAEVPDSPAVRVCAEAVAARLTTHRMAAEEGWKRAAAFSDAMVGQLTLQPLPVVAEAPRTDDSVPQFMRGALQAAAAVPVPAKGGGGGGGGTRSDAGGWRRGRGGQREGMRCFRCGETGHFAQRCSKR
ncbi:hypothetical protein DIPPA_00592 [Diplonema papillatum]|nr:hypothetical protein DIPPA_26953 [Diplonema papillatum]KAJ9435544.1 hypothetical protein DIPPA_05746 [Diplonema papillatum]KAJ9435946.1 hypothetical protein DIPPA_10198 [Diplonema papillatum]KAJ9437107.1 hypothetical protein DIPPA_23416 [Diplonema papillatum]KAJ9441040.1 hypothetical protein DIPPA_35344 [Diplonema papillatum]